MAQQIRVLGIDIAKLVFHVVGMDDTGPVVVWLKYCAESRRLSMIIAQQPPEPLSTHH
jgi:hypothetical protein